MHVNKLSIVWEESLQNAAELSLMNAVTKIMPISTSYLVEEV